MLRSHQHRFSTTLTDKGAEMRTAVAVLIATALAATATTAASPATDVVMDETPHRVPRVESSVSVDGVLDERLWTEALRVELPYEQRPGDGTPADVTTEVLLAYGESHVYAAFIAHDPDPSEIRARLSDRDRIWSDDWVLLVLDTFNSERQAYNFASNPLGVQGDTYESPHGESESWDAIWDSSGRITDDGYVVEMTIPFSSLRFQRTEGDQVWGFDVARNRPRSVSYRYGIFKPDRDNNCYICQYPKLVGFAGASPGRNLEFVPTFSAFNTQQRDDWPAGDFSEANSSEEFGATARWGFTPNLMLAGTVNPDFSHVEADAWQLEVNEQFALHYEEKRPFFLEGEEIFSDRLFAVYTRTLADPEWGVKLTGREGANTIGAFIVRDAMTNLVIPGSEASYMTTLDMKTNAAALRYRRDVGGASAVGLLATAREGDNYYNRVAGVDGYFYFLNSERVDVQVLGSLTSYPDSTSADYGQPDDEFSGFAVDAAYMHSSENVSWHAHYRDVADDFRSDLGFRPQVGSRHFCSGTGYSWLGDSDNWYTRIDAQVGFGQNTESDGDLQKRWMDLTAAYYGPLQSELYMGPAFQQEVYDGVEYDLNLATLFAFVRPSAALSFNFFAGYGDAIDYDNGRAGTSLNLEPVVGCKLGKHFYAMLSHSYEHMNIGEERLYTANVSYLKGIYQFNRRAFLRAILQYADYRYEPEMYVDDVDPEWQHLASQVLFSYKLNPQTVLFLGYSDNAFGEEGVDLTRSDYTLFAKVGYAFAL
jgi:hypothetical protein